MEVGVEEEMVGGFHTTISEAQLLQMSAKGKRTKRPRTSSVQSLNVVAAALTSSSSSDVDQYRLLPSPATTVTSAENTTDEDEDMANCLILLARSGGDGGGAGGQYYGAADQKEMRVIRRRKKIRSSSGIINGTTTTTTTTTSNYSKRATGSEIYECKTCNRCFPSFQALGGHRASHKKPRPPPVPINGGGLEKELIIKMAAEDVTVATTSINVDHLQEEAAHDGGFGLFKEIMSTSTLPTATTSNTIAMMTLMMPPTPPAAVLKSMMIIAPPSSNNSNKNKVHECAICGSEFNSGQALGGHMRRHRIVPELPDSKNVIVINKASKININSTAATTNSSTFTLDLDLNLPAPPDELADHHDLSSDHFAPVAADIEFADASTSTSDQRPAGAADQFGNNKLIMTQEKNIAFKSKQPLLFTPLVDCHN